MSALDEHLKKHRQKIIDREEKTFREMLSAYAEIEKELKNSFDELQKKIEAAQANGETISPLWFFQEKRLKNLLAQVSENIIKFGGTATRIVEREQRAAIQIAVSQARETFNFQIADNPDAADLAQSFAGSFNPRTVENAVGLMGDGSPLASYFEEQLAPLVAERIKTEVIKAAAIGTDFKTISKRLTDAGGITKHRALSVARTEVNRVRRETTRQICQENDDIISGWEWVASKSSRTCPLCLAMDGKTFPLDEPFPQHVNCRCTMISILKGLKRRPRTIGKDWFENQDDAAKESILGKETFKAYKDNNLILDDFVAFRDDKRFGKSVTRKPLAKILADKGEVSTKTNVPDFKTVKEAQKWCEQTYPHIEFDFAKTHVRTIKPTVKEFARLSKAFPEVNDRLEYFGTYQDASKKYHNGKGFKFSTETAHASRDGKRIGINPKYYGKPKVMQDMKRRAKEVNWLVSGEVEGTMTHEFGHQVENWLGALRQHSLTNLESNSEKFAFGNVLDKFYAAFHKDLTYNFSGDWDEWNARRENIIKDLSKYAVTSQAELFAETFSATSYRPTAKRAELLRRFLDQVKTLKLNPEPQEFRLATAAEKAAAEAELRRVLKKFEFLDEFE